MKNKYGKLRIIKRAESLGGIRFLCNCICGKNKIVRLSHLKSGSVSSCGCIRKKMCAKLKYKHGRTHTQEWDAWRNANTRCYNKNCPDYKNYGERGIVVCRRWNRKNKNGFVNFYKDMGRKTHNFLSLDRKNNNGNYTPENCRWATYYQQIHNRRKK